jgi:hypothetical protein
MLHLDTIAVVEHRERQKHMKIHFPVRSAVAVTLSLFMALPPAWAQEASAIKALNIVIIEGEGAINNVRQRVAREPIVEVTDENKKPVSGALVTFLMPGNGPSGVFANGSNTFTVATDNLGRAAARGLKLNSQPGQVPVRVSVSHQGLTASSSFTMTNVAVAAAAGIGLAKVLLILALTGAAVTAGAVAVNQSGGTATVPASVGVTPGTPTVGPPR